MVKDYEWGLWTMNPRFGFLTGVAIVMAVTVSISGCFHGSHPNDKMAVYNNLDKNFLRSVTVSENQDSGVMTLTGIVGNQHLKSLAETAAQQAAPGYRIENRIRVDNTGIRSLVKQAVNTQDADRKIEDDFKASVKSQPALHNLSIYWTAKNRVLVLKGLVKTDKQWREVDNLAKQVPDVQKVIDYIDVGTRKHHPPSNS